MAAALMARKVFHALVAGKTLSPSAGSLAFLTEEENTMMRDILIIAVSLGIGFTAHRLWLSRT
jgi:hypothetical protein